MSFCSNCGTKLNAGDRFCSGCGVAVHSTSVENGATASPGSQHLAQTATDHIRSPQPRASDARAESLSSLNEVVMTIQNSPVMKGASRALLNPATFVLLYSVFMIPTYLLPYLGSNSSIINTLGVAADAGLNPALYWHVATLAVLVLVAWLRGRLIHKTWLAALPVAASCFDLLPGLSMIPMVPTMLHVMTIVVGVMDDRKAGAG